MMQKELVFVVGHWWQALSTNFQVVEVLTFATSKHIIESCRLTELQDQLVLHNTVDYAIIQHRS